MIIGPRLSFACDEEHILCGDGNFVEVRELKDGNFQVIRRVSVFDTTLICGIYRLTSQNGGFVFYGDRMLAILDNNFQVVAKMNLYSWISAVASLDDGTIVILTASSILYKLNGSDFSIEDKLQLESFGVLISGFIRGTNWEALQVFVGVFDFIKMFCPHKSSKATKTFVGHTGMIFAFAQLNGVLYSISDDRSLRAWNIDSGKEIASAFGHFSRPFAIEVSDKVGILTGGADQFVCVWRLNNSELELLQRITFDGGPIRSLRLVDDNLFVGTDTGSLFLLEMNALNFNVEVSVSIECKQINLFLRYPNQQFVIVANRSELWIHSNGRQKLLNEGPVYRPNLLLKVPESDYFSAATVDSIFIYNFAKESLVFHLQLDYTLCFTIWVGNYLFASDDNQNCVIYEFSNETLAHRASFGLTSKQAFISSGFMYNELIFLGTTRGTLFALNRHNFEVLKMVPQLHKKKLITDIKVVDDGKLCTTGKDGKFNIWSVSADMDLNLLFSSSAIEWPAKLLLDSDGKLKFVAGFSGDKFLIVSAQNFFIQFQVYCGGGSHRIWSYDLDTHQLDFISNHKMYSIKTNGSIVRNLEGPFHQSEFTSLACFSSNTDSSKFLLCTGGNDTQIIIYEYDLNTDIVSLRFKNKQHIGSIHDMAICGDFLISVSGFAEFHLWRISPKDAAIHCLDKQKLDLDARLLSVDARLIDDFLVIAFVTSYGSIKLFKYDLNGCLQNSTSLLLDEICSVTKIKFIDNNSLAAITTNGHLISYEIESEMQLVEKRRQFVEKNSLTALNVNEGIAVIGSTSGQISILTLNDSQCDGVLTQVAHGSTVTDIDTQIGRDTLVIFSVSLDRCLVVSAFNKLNNKIQVLKTLPHCIYDPSRVRVLKYSSDEINEKSSQIQCVITGYGMQTISI